MKRLCQTEEEFDRLVACIERAQGPIGFDTEVSGPQLIDQEMVNVYSSTLTGFSVSVDYISWYVPVRHRRGKNLQIQNARKLLTVLATCGKELWAHNWKFDLQVMYGESEMLGEAFEDADLRDSMLAAWLMQYGDTYKLKVLVKEILGENTVDFYEVSGGRSFDGLTPEQALEYACNDAVWTVKIGKHFEDRMKAFDIKLHDTFLNLELPFMRVLRHMEASGFTLDVKELRRQKDLLVPVRDSLYEDWLFLTGGVNPSSGKQVSEWAYGGGHWPTDGIEQGVSGQYKTNADAVTAAYNCCKEGSIGKEAARIKLEYAVVEKILSTYTDNLIINAGQYDDGRLHSSYMQSGTATGRLSSSYPNIQNIPVRTNVGRSLRKAFVARPGYSLVSDDYSQIELRVLAHLAGPGRLLNAYIEGKDIHQQTADLAGVDRNQGKTGNFAIVYGAMGKKLGKTLGMPRKDADAFIENYFIAYPEVGALRDRAVAAARDRGYIRTLARRFRKTPGLSSRNFMDRCSDERRAFNTPIQGGARDLMAKAMVDVYQELRRTGDLGRVVFTAQIHDDLMLECEKGLEKDTERLLQSKMENVWPGFRCPLVAKAISGNTWYDLKE